MTDLDFGPRAAEGPLKRHLLNWLAFLFTSLHPLLGPMRSPSLGGLYLGQVEFSKVRGMGEGSPRKMKIPKYHLPYRNKIYLKNYTKNAVLSLSALLLFFCYKSRHHKQLSSNCKNVLIFVGNAKSYILVGGIGGGQESMFVKLTSLFYEMEKT